MQNKNVQCADNENFIKLTDISKSYGEKTLFDRFSYSFVPGKIYEIVGGNGCGKSTLLRIISSLTSPDKGEVEVKGKIAYVFQEHRLFLHLSAFDNASISAAAVAGKASDGTDNDEYIKIKRNAKEILTLFGFSESDMKKKPSHLSGGMKQAVSIARAFACERKILLLDEANKELDIDARNTFRELLKKRKSDSIIIFVTHNPEDFPLADETIFLPYISNN